MMCVFSCFGLWMLQGSRHQGLFPHEPEHYRGPKLKVAIIGAGHGGMSTTVEILDQGHELKVAIIGAGLAGMSTAMELWIKDMRWIYTSQVGSFVDKGGNHIVFGLHVFFGHYNDLFRGGDAKDFGPTTRKDGNLKLVKEVVDPNRWRDQTDPESALLLNGPKTNLTGGQIVPKMISGMESS
ncbi:zeta-carotene desaturase, chloroplastic/chromoplastic [Artemisia annua]|uniref:Zeta-carotene desaturase, chloroplastic/chromoplastic n=1 Tax=Artemisia annua TaxID=35608 RepID=A0A2U1P7T6_ARTAN|nr:zeta-carotene desaturase, chloroplastic/chromoplastic [Artemisia annua]